jgi:hypothetical protein
MKALFPPHYAAVFTRLAEFGLRTYGADAWLARCPSHEDQMASLSIRVGRNGSLILKCHANQGCTFDSIRAALGLSPGDFFRPGTMPSRQRHRMAVSEAVRHLRERHKVTTVKRQFGEFECAYDYRDAAGKLLYQTVRYKNPKNFRQRRPDGSGKPDAWVYDLSGVGRVLYRLPELRAADPARPVFVPEGEKSVDRMVKLGLVATCNINGAGKWLPEYADELKDRYVVFVQDCDKVNPKTGRRAGRDHCVKAANMCFGKARRLKVWEPSGLAEGEDWDDWVDKQYRAGVRDKAVILKNMKEEVDALPEWQLVDYTEPAPSAAGDDFDQMVEIIRATAVREWGDVKRPEMAYGLLRMTYKRLEKTLEESQVDERQLGMELQTMAAMCKFVHGSISGFPGVGG